MIEIRFHGRGGQGAASACKMFADACFRGGKSVQAFPMFGVERRGAPVQSFVRVSDDEIRARHNIESPHYVFVLSETLMNKVDCSAGIKPGGVMVVNSPKDVATLKRDHRLEGDYEVHAINATEIAVNHGLGSMATPIVNTAMLGVAAKTTGLAEIDDLAAVIEESAPAKQAENAKAARDAFAALEL
jgi:pyruvate ferredoxin oxidoreductase gamma subunit/2-oxoisovalerate ferredoxin oxidoreductase gamma subunit